MWESKSRCGSSMSDGKRPLDNIRVLDFTHVLAGPFCTYQLAVMGADVIKIESSSQPDMMRINGPDGELAKKAMGLHFQTQASNKRALTLDLKHPDSTQILDKLLLDADVLVVLSREVLTKHASDVKVPVAAWRSEHGSPRVESPPPAVGQHTAEILAELGYSPEQIAVYCTSVCA